MYDDVTYAAGAEDSGVFAGTNLSSTTILDTKIACCLPVCYIYVYTLYIRYIYENRMLLTSSPTSFLERDDAENAAGADDVRNQS